MSEASAHKLSYIAEATRGTTPDNPRFQALPDTRTTLALTRDSLSSERITGSRFPAEPRSGAKGVSGDVPADLSTRAYDDFIASALQGEWAESGGQDQVSIDAMGGGPTTYTRGSVIPMDGENNLVLEFLDSKTEHIVLRHDLNYVQEGTYEVFGLDTLVVEGFAFEILGYTDAEEDATVKAGDTRKSFSVLREFSDFGSGEKPFLLYAGCEVATWNLTAAANGLAKSTFTFWGRDMAGPSATAPVNSSVAPAFDTEPFDTFSGAMEIDDVETCIVTDYNLTINNGHAPRYGIGCDTSGDASVNQSLIEGSITAYFEDASLYEKFVNEESMALRITLSDLAGNQMVVYLPNCKVGSGTQPDVSADGPITITINFTAHKDEALGSHVSVQRIYPLAA